MGTATNGAGKAERAEELLAKYSEDIERFILMDDTFMSAVFKDKECAEVLLGTILGKKLEIYRIDTQYSIPNLKGRLARLDIKAKDAEGQIYNVEVQNDNEGAVPERARYNASLMDTEALPKGKKWEELPDSYVILITRSDILGGGKPIYHIERTIRELDGRLFRDRSYVVYVNSKVRDDTELGRLMHDFYCKDPAEMYNKTIADRVGHFKKSREGGVEMCEIMDRLITNAEKEKEIEVRLQDIKRIMVNCDISAEKAMDNLGLDKEEQDMYLGLLGLKA